MRGYPWDLGDAKALKKTISKADVVIYSIGLVKGSPQRYNISETQFDGVKQTVDIAIECGINMFLSALTGQSLTVQSIKVQNILLKNILNTLIWIGQFLDLHFALEIQEVVADEILHPAKGTC